jgi:PAS domain S-box-containing protein
LQTEWGGQRADAPGRVQVVTDPALEYLGLDALLDDLLARIRDAVSADTVVILLAQEGSSELHAAAVLNFEEEIADRVRVPIGAGFAGRIAATGQPLAVEDLDKADVVNHLLRRRGLRSLLGVPLFLEEEVIGVLHVGTLERRIFTAEDIDVLEGIAGRIALAIGRARAHHAERLANSRLAFLAEASHLLASSLDYEKTLAEVGRLAVPAIADWYSVTLVEDGELRPVSIAHADPARVEEALELQRLYPPRLDGPGVGSVIRSGEPEVIQAITDEMLVEGAQDDRHLELLRRLGLSSAMTVPLVVGERTLGAISFVVSDPVRQFDADDMRLAEDLARRAAVAIENARLHEAEQQARARAELLQQVTVQLAQARTQQDVANVLVRDGATALGAAAGWAALLDPVGEQVDMIAAVGYPDAVVESYRSIPVDWAIGAGELLRDGEARWLESADAVANRYPGHADVYRKTGYEALAIVPLVIGGVARGFVCFNFAEKTDFDDATRAMMLAVAGQCAQALERARLYDQQTERANASLVLANVDDGVFQVDYDGVVRLWNPAAEHVTGISEAEALGRRVGDVLGGWEHAVRAIEIVQRPRGGHEQETVPVDIRGEERWLALSGVRSPDGTVYAFRDVTAERGLERSRRDFLATASHELRTPLGAVYGAAQTLVSLELDEDRRKTLLQIVIRECERLTRIVDDLLLANNLDLDAVRVQPETADAVALAREVAELRDGTVPEGTTLTVDANGTAIEVACDRDRLRQVLVNLVDNAIKYSPQGGEVRITVRTAGAYGRFVVSDEGIGIPQSEHVRIFEKFYRLDPELSRGVGGSGLGLYISRELVRRMDGRLTVESEPGRGSSFTVELPLAG